MDLLEWVDALEVQRPEFDAGSNSRNSHQFLLFLRILSLALEMKVRVSLEEKWLERTRWLQQDTTTSASSASSSASSCLSTRTQNTEIKEIISACSLAPFVA